LLSFSKKDRDLRLIVKDRNPPAAYMKVNPARTDYLKSVDNADNSAFFFALEMRSLKKSVKNAKKC
jgi:hypothetical protein